MYNPFKPFIPEIIDRIIRPKIDHILETRPDEIQKKADIATVFNDEFKTNISQITMAAWLDLMGYQTSRRFTIQMPRRPEDELLKPPLPQPTPNPQAPGAPRMRPRPIPGVGGLVGGPFPPPR